MKKITLALCMAVSATCAFSQSSSAYNNNSHGQNDCQCIGIGIPAPYVGPNIPSSAQNNDKNYSITVNNNEVKGDVNSGGMLYMYYEILMAEIHMKLDAHKGK